jgi:hypothetical protein
MMGVGGMRPVAMEKSTGLGRWGDGSALGAGVIELDGVAVVGERRASVDRGVGRGDGLEANDGLLTRSQAGGRRMG